MRSVFRHKLRTQALVFVLLAMLGFLGILITVELWAVRPNLLSLERDEALKDAIRAVNAIRNDIGALRATTVEWAMWDELHSYIEHRNPSFGTAHLDSDSVARLNLDLLALYDLNGRKVSCLTAHAESGEQWRFEEFARDTLPFGHPARASTTTPTSGIVKTEHGPLMMCAHPILKSDGSGPANGTLVFGRRLDSALVATLAAETHVNFTVQPAAENSFGSEVESLKARDGRAISITRDDQHGETRVAAQLTDLAGGNGWIVLARIPCEISRRGLQAQLYSRALSLAGAIVLAAGICWLLQWIVVRPLAHLTRHAISIGQAAELPPPLAWRRVDELGLLATELDGMVSRMAAQLEQYRQSQESLRASETRFRAIVEDQSELICRFDGTMRVSFVNHAFARFHRMAGAECLGRDLSDFLPGPHAEDIIQELRQLDVQRPQYVKEFIVLDRSDQPAWLRWTCRAIFNENEREPEYQAVALDITERKLAELSLENALEVADRANRSKGEFLANMSHEIRTPLTAILGYAELLMTSDRNATESMDYARIIARNGELLLAIINDILDLSKIDAGKLELERLACSPRQAVEEVRQLLQVRADEKGLAFRDSVAANVPGRIWVDPLRLRQILLNLAGNAIKFTNSGSVRIEVELSSLSGRGSARLFFHVRDTGIGLSVEAQRRLFRSFAQADSTTTRKYGGTGLGLAISKRLAVLMGGDILLSSAPGYGSCFTLALPCEVADDSESIFPRANGERGVEPSLSALGAEPAIDRSLVRILLAEDGAENQRLITALLEKLGYQVEVVADGKMALEAALSSETEKKPYDLILMDMQMPEMDGYEATRRLRQASWMGPVIALTAHAMSGNREECLAAGCTDFATKPIKRRDLEKLCERHLRAKLSSEAAPQV
ncbi:MAG: CHASE4 domain-containing protein [Planctomycetota bacterium]